MLILALDLNLTAFREYIQNARQCLRCFVSPLSRKRQNRPRATRDVRAKLRELLERCPREPIYAGMLRDGSGGQGISNIYPEGCKTYIKDTPYKYV